MAFDGRRLAGIQYIGIQGVSCACKRAIQRLVLAGERIEHATLLTAGQSHAFLLGIEPHELIAVKSGFSSGYAGEGPRTLSEVLGLLETFGAQLEEVEVSEALMLRLDQSALTQRDLDGIERASPVRPMRWHQYILPSSGHEPINTVQIASLPAVMPWSLIDERLVKIALGFEANPDHALLLGFRQLEDIVRSRLGQEVAEGRVMAAAFAGDRSKLTWDKLSGGEHSARGQLFTGAYGAFRNPRAHRLIANDTGLALQEFLLLNLLYTLESSAVERLEDPPEQESKGAQK